MRHSVSLAPYVATLKAPCPLPHFPFPYHSDAVNNVRTSFSTQTLDRSDDACVPNTGWVSSMRQTTYAPEMNIAAAVP